MISISNKARIIMKYQLICIQSKRIFIINEKMLYLSAQSEVNVPVQEIGQEVDVLYRKLLLPPL